MFSSLDPTAGASSYSHKNKDESTVQKLQIPTFDPALFLNDVLPTLPSQSAKASRAAQLQELSSQVQGILAKLNAETTRQSEALTQLTDEILRNGSRQSYLTEVLRVDVNSLYDALTDTLKEDIMELGLGQYEQDLHNEATIMNNGVEDSRETKGLSSDPEFIGKLRTLSQVKSRLEEVVRVFGEAMEWPLAPSDLSITSSLISVSAPEAGPESASREEKGREAAKKLRSELVSALDSNSGGFTGLAAATLKVEALRDLAGVWKGTAEEKPRLRLVDSLDKHIQDRRNMLAAANESSQPRKDSATQHSSSVPGRLAVVQARTDRNVTDGGNAAGGLLRNLQRLRDEIYLE